VFSRLAFMAAKGGGKRGLRVLLGTGSSSELEERSELKKDKQGEQHEP